MLHGVDSALRSPTRPFVEMHDAEVKDEVCAVAPDEVVCVAGGSYRKEGSMWGRRLLSMRFDIMILLICI